MPEELGKIEKPSAEEYLTGRKLFFIPLILTNQGLPPEFGEKYDRYWEQVESQIANLEDKLVQVNRIYHELVPETGEKGLEDLKQLKTGSLSIIQTRVEKGAVLENVEDADLLAELMDWSRCLSIGLQSQKVFSTIYGLYTEANKKRNEHISKKIGETLKENEAGILIMAEGHQVQFPADIRIFYVAPPALDDLKRWMRDFESKSRGPQPKEPAAPEEHPENKEAGQQ
jgi:hypothetical protein